MIEIESYGEHQTMKGWEGGKTTSEMCLMMMTMMILMILMVMMIMILITGNADGSSDYDDNDSDSGGRMTVIMMTLMLMGI